MGYIWSIYGYFEALISQILAFLWSEFLLYQFSAPNLDKGTIFFPTPPPPPNDWTIYTSAPMRVKPPGTVGPRGVQGPIAPTGQAVKGTGWG